MPAAGLRRFLRNITGSLAGAAALLAWDGGMCGSFLASVFFCPAWFLVSLARNARERPGWGVALARVGMPALTLWLAKANSDFQLGVAEANARPVIAACEAFRVDHGSFPKKLDELTPRYLDAVPRAKYCLGPAGRFSYHNLGSPLLY